MSISFTATLILDKSKVGTDIYIYRHEKYIRIHGTKRFEMFLPLMLRSLYAVLLQEI